MQTSISNCKMGVGTIIFTQLLCGALALRSLQPLSDVRIPAASISLGNTQLQTIAGRMLTTTNIGNDNAKQKGMHIMNCLNNCDRRVRVHHDDHIVENSFGRSLGGKVHHLFRKLAIHLQLAKHATRNFAKQLHSFIASLLIFSGQMNIFNVMTRSAGLPVAAMMMAPESALASPFVKYSNLKSTQKLSTTPVFYLSNSGGSPYLQEDVQVNIIFIITNHPQPNSIY